MDTSVSIVVINLNNAEGLRATLESIVNQRDLTDGIFECDVLVVDGLSTDRSLDVAKEYAKSHAQIQVCSERDSGVYDAMNKGIVRTAGLYIIFMNSGDRFSSSTALLRISRELASHPAWLIAGAENLGGGVRDRAVIRNLPHSWFRHAMGVQPHCHQACVFRRDLITALGGYREDFGLVGDFDLILRSGAVTRPRELNETLVEYEGGGLSERAWRSVPRLQHQVRVDVLDLRGVAAALDQLWSQYLVARRSISHIKTRASSVRPGSRRHGPK